MTSSKKRDQGYALDPRGKEKKIKDLAFWPNGNRGGLRLPDNVESGQTLFSWFREQVGSENKSHQLQ
jgi:hypothetical protein